LNIESESEGVTVLASVPLASTTENDVLTALQEESP